MAHRCHESPVLKTFWVLVSGHVIASLLDCVRHVLDLLLPLGAFMEHVSLVVAIWTMWRGSIVPKTIVKTESGWVGGKSIVGHCDRNFAVEVFIDHRICPGRKILTGYYSGLVRSDGYICCSHGKCAGCCYASFVGDFDCS